MKFGEVYSEYLDAEDDRFLQKCRHLEYEELKNVLKKCSHAGEAPEHVENEICPGLPTKSLIMGSLQRPEMSELGQQRQSNSEEHGKYLCMSEQV